MARRTRTLKREDFKSRKFWYGIGTSIAIMACGVLAAKWPSFGVNLPTVLGSLIGVYTVYTGTNIGSKFVQGKVAIPEEPSSPGQPIEPIPDETQ